MFATRTSAACFLVPVEFEKYHPVKLSAVLISTQLIRKLEAFATLMRKDERAWTKQYIQLIYGDKTLNLPHESASLLKGLWFNLFFSYEDFIEKCAPQFIDHYQNMITATEINNRHLVLVYLETLIGKDGFMSKVSKLTEVITTLDNDLTETVFNKIPKHSKEANVLSSKDIARLGSLNKKLTNVVSDLFLYRRELYSLSQARQLITLNKLLKMQIGQSVQVIK
jgi:hypothetical protein